MSAQPAFAEVLARGDVWRGGRLAGALPALSSGFPELDAELPGGGWPRGQLTELLVDARGIGELGLLLPALAVLGGEERWTLFVAPPRVPNAPAWAAAGIDLGRLAVIAPERPGDALWAAEQALASGAPGAVLCWPERLDARQARRLQVAAGARDGLAFVFRPGAASRETSPAPLRLALAAGPRGTLAVDIVKRRGPPCARPLHLTLPRPAPWRTGHEFGREFGREFGHDSGHESSDDSPVACPAPAIPAARSARPAAVA